MITAEYIARKMWNLKNKKRFEHKSGYLQSQKDTKCYDMQAHREEYRRIKETKNPLLWIKE
jgi:hypothetical protein